MNTALFQLPAVHIPATPAAADFFGSRHAAKRSNGFFEFVPTGDGALALAVGDVMGEGPAASVIRSAARSAIINMAARHCGQVSVALHQLNKTLYWLSPEDCYTSVFYAHLDPALRILHYANAGHEPALLIRAAGGIERLDNCGGVLGLTQRTRFQAHARTVLAGDVLVAAGAAPGICDPAHWDVWERAAADVVRDRPQDTARDLLYRIVEASGAREWTLAVLKVLSAAAHPDDRFTHAAEVYTLVA